MGEVVLPAIAIGMAFGGYVGYHVGQWRAASRAARNTFRSVRGR
ncbi:hypothetical protein [Goekera deserti]|nr:hypothetical protein [Goekera deserti]